MQQLQYSAALNLFPFTPACSCLHSISKAPSKMQEPRSFLINSCSSIFWINCLTLCFSGYRKDGKWNKTLVFSFWADPTFFEFIFPQLKGKKWIVFVIREDFGVGFSNSYLRKMWISQPSRLWYIYELGPDQVHSSRLSSCKLKQHLFVNLILHLLPGSDVSDIIFVLKNILPVNQ